MNQRVDKDSLPLDKPRRTPSHPTKSHIVKTRVDGKEKIIRFGEQGAETAGKPKAGESERMKNKRASFKSRHAKNIAKGKSSPAYWANKVKWADGGRVTGMTDAEKEKAKDIYGQAAASMLAAGVTNIGGRSVAADRSGPMVARTMASDLGNMVELDRDIFASDDTPNIVPTITPMPVSDNVAQPPQQMGILGTLKSIPSGIANDLKMGWQAGMFRGRDKQLENLTNAGYNPAQIQDYFARTDATLARDAAEAAMRQDRGDTSPQNQYSELANSFAQEYNIVGRNRSQLMPLLENFLRSRGILQPTSYSDKIFEALSVPMQQGGSVNLEEMYQKYERGGKARGSLLEGFIAELERLRSLQRKQDSLEFRPEYIGREQPLARRYDRAPTRSDPTRSDPTRSDADPQTAGVPTERSPTGMNPNFASALENLIAAASEAGHDVTINSGYRSPERQAELFADAVRKYGSEAAARRWVAPPGRSRHNHGIAADLGYGSDEARDWVHANAEKYGLNFRMDWEPWHIEPLNMKRGGAASLEEIYNRYAEGGSVDDAPGGDDTLEEMARDERSWSDRLIDSLPTDVFGIPISRDAYKTAGMTGLGYMVGLGPLISKYNQINYGVKGALGAYDLAQGNIPGRVAPVEQLPTGADDNAMAQERAALNDAISSARGSDASANAEAAASLSSQGIGIDAFGGYAMGGSVRAYDPAAVEALMASVGNGYAKGGLKTHDGFEAVQNPDGSVSTEISITVQDPRLNEGRPTNIPSLWDRKVVDDDTAVERALKSGKKYNSYETIEEAVRAARQRSSNLGTRLNKAEGGYIKYDPALVDTIVKTFREGTHV